MWVLQSYLDFAMLEERLLSALVCYVLLLLVVKLEGRVGYIIVALAVGSSFLWRFCICHYIHLSLSWRRTSQCDVGLLLLVDIIFAFSFVDPI